MSITNVERLQKQIEILAEFTTGIFEIILPHLSNKELQRVAEISEKYALMAEVYGKEINSKKYKTNK